MFKLEIMIKISTLIELIDDYENDSNKRWEWKYFKRKIVLSHKNISTFIGAKAEIM